MVGVTVVVALDALTSTIPPLAPFEVAFPPVVDVDWTVTLPVTFTIEPLLTQAFKVGVVVEVELPPLSLKIPPPLRFTSAVEESEPVACTSRPPSCCAAVPTTAPAPVVPAGAPA